jgi:hypothetical protein
MQSLDFLFQAESDRIPNRLECRLVVGLVGTHGRALTPMAGYVPLTRQACFLVPLRGVHALHNEPQAK